MRFLRAVGLILLGLAVWGALVLFGPNKDVLIVVVIGGVLAILLHKIENLSRRIDSLQHRLDSSLH